MIAFCTRSLRLSTIASTPLSLSSAGFSVVAVLGDESFQLLGDRGDVAGDLVQRSALALQRTSSALVLATRPTISSLRSASTLVALLALASRLRSCASRCVEGLGEPRHARRTATFSSRWGVWRRCRASTGKRLGQLVGVQSADGGGEITQRVGQLVGRGGPLQRYRPAGRPSPRGVTSRILAPSRLLVLIAASVRSPSADVVVDVELDQHPRPVQFDG